MTLQDITKQESGIVLYGDGDMIICNWSSIDGMPRLDPTGSTPLGLGDALSVESDAQDITDTGAWLDDRQHNLIYDRNDDYAQLHGQTGKLYSVSGATVIAPGDWN